MHKIYTNVKDMLEYNLSESESDGFWIARGRAHIAQTAGSLILVGTPLLASRTSLAQPLRHGQKEES